MWLYPCRASSNTQTLALRRTPPLRQRRLCGRRFAFCRCRYGSSRYRKKMF